MDIKKIFADTRDLLLHMDREKDKVPVVLDEFSDSENDSLVHPHNRHTVQTHADIDETRVTEFDNTTWGACVEQAPRALDAASPLPHDAESHSEQDVLPPVRPPFVDLPTGTPRGVRRHFGLVVMTGLLRETSVKER